MKKKVILCPNPYKDCNLSVTLEAKDILEHAGVETVVCPEFLDEQPAGIPSDIRCTDLYDALPGAALVVSLGGDGTIMHTIRRMIGYDVPVLGVNLGTVGFLAELERGDLGVLPAAAAGRFTPSLRMMLHIEVERAGTVVFSNYALNDVSLQGIVQMIHMTVRGDGRKILEFSGDGVVISSPTGSTAYSMSAGGPLVEPEAENLIVTPVCAHALAARSFVLSPERVVTVELGDLRGKAVFSVDGGCFDGQGGDILRVRKAEYRTMIAHVSEMGFYDIVFEKLRERK